MDKTHTRQAWLIPNTTLYKYDALGNLYCVEQHGSAATGTACPATPPGPADPPVPPVVNNAWRRRMFAYDSLSRLRWASNPESGVISYTYDANGNLLQKTSPAPNQTGVATLALSYCYDALNRVTGKAYSAQTCQNGQLPAGTAAVSYTYDQGTNGIGHLTNVVDQAGSGTYSYESMGRLTAETRVIAGVSKVLAYTYNLDGSLKTLTYPSNRVVTYSYDSAGHPTTATDSNGTTYVSSASYTAPRSLARFVSGSTITSSFLYNSRLQLCRITAYSSGSVPSSCADPANHGNLMDRSYNFNFGAANNGNVIGITNYRDSSRSESFTYDSLNRITSGWSTANTGVLSWGETYSIDAWGNLNISPMAGKAHGGYFPNASNGANQPVGLGYDAAGNLTNYTAPGQYFYDPENRLQSTAGITYAYDANGQRVLKSNTSTGAAVKRYWSGGGNTVAEGDGAGNITSEYVYFGGTRVARVDLPGNSVHYYLSDHLGSTSMVTTATGGIEEESDYSAFGTEYVATAGGNNYKFTGKERDSESGLDYFGARYYSNGLGRFVTPDWSAVPVPVPYADLGDPQSLNQYSYVRNIPTVKVDADGHGTCPPVCDIDQEVRELVDSLSHLLPVAPAAGPALAAAGPPAALAAPSVIGMGLVIAGPKFELPEDGNCGGDCSIYLLQGSANPGPDTLWDWILGKKPPAPTPNTQPATPTPQPKTPPAPQAAEHTKNKSKVRKDDHEKRRPGTSPPPNYKPDREHEQPKDDKKKDKEKPPYHRKDRDKK